MWTRDQLKTRAKAVLKVSYWKAFVVSLVMILLGAGQGQFNLNDRFNGQNNTGGADFSGILSSGARHILPFAIAIFTITAGIVLIFIAIRIFLGYAIEVGGRRFFINAAKDDADLNNLGYAFSESRFKSIIKAMLYRGVITFLWTLLFVVPGIIKSYAYKMVPYILAENPNIDHKRALEISNDMTYGQKWDIFVLDLSFIGWNLLGALLFGIGSFFVAPYISATEAELYLVLRENAINIGICSEEELRPDPFIK